ncbi:MAG TPA: hypothetical protein PKW83_00010 [Verrucomicrobiota bacterium]|nr:hypothetical protein [Verrucomicrobiota bacterium]
MKKRKPAKRQTLQKRIAAAPSIREAISIALRGESKPPRTIEEVSRDLAKRWYVVRFLREWKRSKAPDWERACEALNAIGPSIEKDTSVFVIHAMAHNRPQDVHDLATAMEHVNKAKPFAPDLKRWLLLNAMKEGRKPNIYRLAKQCENEGFVKTSERELRRIYRELQSIAKGDK